MINRFVFIIGILVFGLSLYLLGTLTDLSLTSVDTQKLAGQASDAFHAESGVQSATKDKTPEPTKSAPLPNIDSTSLKLKATDKTVYTLLVGRYTQQLMAEQKRKSLPAMEQDISIIALIDDQNVQWFWVTVGKFNFIDARKQVFRLKQLYQLDAQIKVLPEPPVAAS